MNAQDRQAPIKRLRNHKSNGAMRVRRRGVFLGRSAFGVAMAKSARGTVQKKSAVRVPGAVRSAEGRTSKKPAALLTVATENP